MAKEPRAEERLNQLAKHRGRVEAGKAGVTQNEPEIWFRWFLLSPIPCHWKGFAITLAMAAALLVVLYSVDLLINSSAPLWVAPALLIGFMPAWFAAMIFVWRHTR